MSRSTPRLQLAWNSIYAALGHQSTSGSKYADECSNVNSEVDRSIDKVSENGHELNGIVGATTNGIQLLDVASLSSEGSQGHTNEDRLVVMSDERFHLFAVMDGHGGAQAGDFLVEELFKTLDRVYDDGFDHVELSHAMEELDRTFCALATSKLDMSGACLLAVLLYVDPKTDSPQKIVLNIGDCRAIAHEVCESTAEKDSKEKKKKKKKRVDQTLHGATHTGKTLALSRDHCASNRKERERVLRSGAFISGDRIGGVLEPFRTIGDIDMKGRDMKNWVIATPEIHQSDLLVGRSTLVIATDGVWTVLNNSQTMALVLENLGGKKAAACAKSAARAVVEKARELGSCDDITVIVISV
ncbi:unnamed protein product [Hyaloperonospora brassicae]|uniref:PPM-type phosphatase domain-containing protein n=1 Tax=Hyaloperonospora brassicae TaxID=162125 RepID=A0AAV0V1X7_HYABA|nr:unnamed protein product [Hyaloperonospora brassicae]